VKDLSTEQTTAAFTMFDKKSLATMLTIADGFITLIAKMDANEAIDDLVFRETVCEAASFVVSMWTQISIIDALTQHTE
jgi:hypothetical protein